MIERTCLAVLLGLLGLACGLQCPKQKISPGREVVCYTSVSDVDQLTEAVCKCTTLVQQGHDVRNVTVSEFVDFRKSLKQIIPTLQFVISVNDYGKALRTSGTVRQEITARLMGVLKEVDGVELNMTAGSKERLVHFVKGLKDELVRKSYDKRIFLVLPTKSEDLAKQFDLKELSKYVDLFTVSTHYLVEDDGAYRTFHPSRLMGLFDMYNADSLIDLITGLGAPKRKILVSVPANAYRFTLKDQDDNAPRAATEEMQPVVIDQKQLCDLMSKGEWTVERDEDLTAPYAFKDNTWIAFEDKISVAIKGKYVMVRELPGLAIHDIENDFKTKCGGPVTHEVHHSFSDFKRKSRAAVLNALEDDLHQTELEYSTKVKSSDFRVVRVVDTEGHIRAVRENTQTEFTCSRQGYFVHPKSCNRFYRCVKFNQEVEDYSVFEFDCPAGLSFDERTEVCVWPGSMPEGSPCPGSSEIAPVARVRFECPSKAGYYADPQNPRWFFACIDLGGPEMMAYEFRCPFGLIFDEQKLICEWPWLVAGYSGNGYTASGYGGGAYGTGSTPGSGGYYTGGLPNGYTGAPGGGQYSGTTGTKYSGTGSGISGPAGVGYAGGQGSSFGPGSGGSGYTGSGAGGHGTTYGGQGGGGYYGAAGTGTGTGTGTVGGHGVSYGGQGSGGYSGTTGSGYTGSGAGGHGASYGGQGSGGYTGTTGSGYTGSGAGGHGITYGGQGGGRYSGTTGTGYTESGSGGRGTSYGGQGTSGQGVGGYSGATGGGYSGADHETSYGGQGSGGYSGTTGSGYSGSGTVQAGTGHRYSGTGTGGYTVSTGKAGSSGYGGSSGTGYTGSTSGIYTGSDGTQYSGATGTGQVSVGSGYAGTGSAEHSGTGGIYGGTAGTGYTGGPGSSTGHRYSGQGTTGHGSGYVGSTDGGYSGDHEGSTGGYQGAGGIHGGSTGGYQGAGGIQGGPTGGYQGAGGIQGGSTGGYSGAGGIHGGSTGPGYGGSTGGGYTGATGTGTGYSGSSGGYADGAGGTQVTVTQDYGGTGGGYPGPHGIQHPGSSAGVDYSGIDSTKYSGQTITKYPGPSFGSHDGSSVPGYSVTFGTRPSQTPIYGSAGATGTGLTQTPGPIFVDKPNPPTCITSCSDGSQPSGGQTYVTDGYISSHGVTGGTNIYQGTSGYLGGLNATYVGSNVPSIGGATYHGGTTSGYGITIGAGSATPPRRPYIQGSISTGGSAPGTPVIYGDTSSSVLTGSSDQGSIVTGGSYPGYTKSGPTTPGYGITIGAGSATLPRRPNIQGSISTGGSTPGTVISYGDTSGSVLTGSSDQGSIVTGGSYPGYSKSGPTTPGYVISGGVKTVYPGSASPGVTVYGTPAPGVVVTGVPEVGTVIKGQTSPGIVLTGQTAPGVSFGGSIDQGKTVGSTFTSPGYSIQHGGVSPGSPYGTKIGTVSSDAGYKTNEYHDNGGRGTIRFNNGDVTTKYTENDIPDYRPAGGTIPPDTLLPGSKGVPGASTPTGFSKTGPIKTGFTTATLGAGGSYVISTGKSRPVPNPDNIGEKAFAGNVAGYTKSSTESTADYSGGTSTYDHVGRVDSSRITLGPSKGAGYSYPTPAIPFETGVHKNQPISATEGSIIGPTTPTPFLNVEVYNTPKFGDSSSITGSGSIGQPYPTGGTYTTGPFESYKTTIFEAAKIPLTISTVHPIIDTGYQTIVSSTPLPETQGKYGGGVQTGSQFDFGTKTSQQGGYRGGNYISSTIPSVYQSTTPRYDYGSATTPSGSGYYGSTSKNLFGQTVTPSGGSESLKPQTQYVPGGSISSSGGATYKRPFQDVTYQQSTPSGVPESGDGSPANVAIARDEVGKLITNYNRGTTKYVPSQYDVYSTGSISGADYSKTHSSSGSTYQQGYGSTTPASNRSPFAVTTYSGGYSKPSSILTYQTTAKSTALGKGKVIVKWSDLHPLLLGKLGAECTCRGDPFANLRGPGSKLINSSKGKVDLSNYDDSEIYVDLEKEDEYGDKDYSVTSPVKVWNDYSSKLSGSSSSQIQQQPSTTYLPGVTHSGSSLCTRSTLSGSSSRGLIAGHRSAKSLNSVSSSTNSVSEGTNSNVGRYEGIGESEEITDGATNCARPGLFRHPNFCNKFYACHWDDWKKRFTLHVFNCPVHLTFDNGASACNWPSMGPACQDDNLLV